MDHPAFYNTAYHKQLVINSVVTCVYLPLLLFWLHYTDTLHSIGDYQESRALLFLFGAEIVKYLACWQFFSQKNEKKGLKTSKTHSFKFYKFFKSVIVLFCVVVLAYIVTVLLGAPFFFKHVETFSFALITTTLTALPCCLHLGPDSVVHLILSLTYFEGSETYEKFLINLRLTIFGAWLSAVVIPLDWNRPYQVWPIPCVLGSIAGCFCANIYLAALYWWSTIKQKQKTFKV